MSGFDGVYYPCGIEAKNEELENEENVFFKAVIFKYAHLEHISHSMALDMGRKNKNIKNNLCVCGRECICIPGSCGQMYGHGLQVWVSRSWCKTDEEDISSLPPQASVCLCTSVCGCVCVCVRVGGCVCPCVLNSTEQVVRYRPNTVAWQMVDLATCIPFGPPGQTPASPH